MYITKKEKGQYNMIQTHKGTGKDARNQYRVEVWKQGHIHTLEIIKNEEEPTRYWCEDMKDVRKKMGIYCPVVKLERIPKELQV